MSSTAATANVFLPKIAELPLGELEKIARELRAVIVRKKRADLPSREGFLLKKINQAVLPASQRARFFELAEKLGTDEMSDAEHTEFMILTEQDEQLRNERVKFLIELAQLRRISLPKLMLDLGLATAVENG